MTAAGLGLNKFCYAGLIAAHRNKEPVTDDVASKVSNKCVQCAFTSFPFLLYFDLFDFVISWSRLLS